MILNSEERKNSIIFSVFLIFGIFFPTSFNGIMNNKLSYLDFFVLFIAFGFLIKKKYNYLTLILFGIINLTLLIFTISASFLFSNYSFGIYPNFLFLSLLFFLDLKSMKVDLSVKNSFLFCTFLLIFFAFGVIFQVEWIKNIILNYYIAGYDDLLPHMLGGLKPVGPFATHSVAAFFLFLFFFLNIKSYKTFKKSIYLMNAFALLIALFFIRSNTSLVYLGFSFCILFNLFKSNKSSLKIMFLIIVIIFIYLVYINNEMLEFVDKFDINTILFSDGNGIRGRYSDASPLQPTIDWIFAHPFIPVGLTFSDKLYYTDSGFILYILRGSVLMMMAIYFGFYRFIRTNIVNKNDSLLLVFFIMLFEIGYPILINIRMLFFIPFLIVYLNFLYSFIDES